MLLTEHFNNVKVIIQNIVNPDPVENGLLIRI